MRIAGLLIAFHMVHPNAENQIRFSAVSQKILLMELNLVEKHLPKSKDGFVLSSVAIKGRVIEAIRGAKPKEEFSCDVTWKVGIDELTFPKLHDRTPHDWDRAMVGDFYGVQECKPGQRYIAIFAPGYDQWLFISVKTGDDSWRDEILPLDPDLAEKLFSGNR